jgi:cobalt-zinc-cadmium efflux system protein
VQRALAIALGLNAAFLAIEVTAGLLTNSLALLSDAGHMLSDVVALALAIAAERIARLEPGGSFTFGLKRVPVLGALGNAITLLGIVAIIFWEAGQRLVAPVPVPGGPVLVVGVAGLLVNGISAWWLYRSGGESLNIRGAMLHLLADALGSIGAILSAVVLLATGWAPIDALISFLIGGLILIGTAPMFIASLKVLLQAAPSCLDLPALRAMLEAGERVQSVADLHVWELNSGQLVLTAVLLSEHLSLHDLQESGDRLRELLGTRFGIGHATFEWRTPDRSPLGCSAAER